MRRPRAEPSGKAMPPVSVPAPSDNHGFGSRIALALFLIVLGPALYVGYERWLSKQTFTGFELPVSLSPGHIKTAAFYIHLKERYFIQIRIAQGPYEGPPCPVIWDSSFRSRWTLFRDGQAIKEATSSVYWDIGDFYADKEGSYSIDLEVLSDASCLNARHPRLKVFTWSGNYRNQVRFAGWFSMVPVLGGLGLIGVVITRLFRPRTSAEAIAQSKSDRSLAKRRQLRRRRFEGLPPFGLVATLWFVVVGAIFWSQPWGGNSRGVSVFVAAKLPLSCRGAAKPEPLVIRVTLDGNFLPQVHVSSRLITLEKLRPTLRDKLKHRADWTVCVEAERDVAWEHVVQVMDIAQGELATIVLVTRPETPALMLRGFRSRQHLDERPGSTRIWNQAADDKD